MFSYFDITVKLLVGFICLVFQINLSGKGNLAPTNAIDQLQNYVLGGIIGGMIYNTDITILQFFLVLLIWTLIVLISKFATNHNRYIKTVIDGEPINLVKNGEILVKNATAKGISAHDLSFKLRTAGIFDIRTVKRAILEQNGQLTITQVGDSSVKYPIVMDGQIDLEALESLDHDEVWLNEQLQQQGYQVSDVYMANYLDNKLEVFPYKNH